jgi:hypothetical protein
MDPLSPMSSGACNSILEHSLPKLEIEKCKIKQSPREANQESFAYSLLWCSGKLYSISKESVKIEDLHSAVRKFPDWGNKN